MLHCFWFHHAHEPTLPLCVSTLQSPPTRGLGAFWIGGHEHTTPTPPLNYIHRWKIHRRVPGLALNSLCVTVIGLYLFYSCTQPCCLHIILNGIFINRRLYFFQHTKIYFKNVCFDPADHVNCTLNLIEFGQTVYDYTTPGPNYRILTNRILLLWITWRFVHMLLPHSSKSSDPTLRTWDLTLFLVNKRHSIQTCWMKVQVFHLRFSEKNRKPITFWFQKCMTDSVWVCSSSLSIYPSSVLIIH